MSQNMFSSEVELGKFLGSIDIIPYAFRAIEETSSAYELHTTTSGIKVLAFKNCSSEDTTRFLNKEFDLVSLENHKTFDFISTKVNPKVFINGAAIQLFEHLSEDLKELEKQWKDRFEDFIECKDNGHLILQSYREGPATYDEEAPPNPLVVPAGTAPPPPVVLRKKLPLKDKPRKTAEELERVKADRLARSYLLQGLTNEIYTHVDIYKDAKSMWDEIAKQMQGSELSSSAKITKVLTEYEGFKQSAGELLIDTYNRYCTLLNDIRRNDLVKSKLEINIKFLKNLRPEWKPYAMNVMADKFFKDMDIHDVLEKLQLFQEDVDGVPNVQSKVDSPASDPLALVAQQRHSSHSSKAPKTDYQLDDKSHTDSSDDDDELSKAMALLTTAMQRRFYKKPTNNQQRTSSYSKRPEYQSKPPQGYKPDYVSSSTPAKPATKANQFTCFNCNKVGHLAKDCRAPKVRDSNYYKNKMLLAKQQEAGVALLAEDAEWLNLSDEETEDVEVNMCFMGKMQQVDTVQDPDAPVSTSCSEDDEV